MGKRIRYGRLSHGGLSISITFGPHCCTELEQIKPDIFMLAEAPAADPNYFAAGFDAAYDWKGGPNGHGKDFLRPCKH